MSDAFIRDQIDQDFDKAKGKALFESIFNVMRPEKRELLSFYSIKELVKPRSETYRGMKTVNISDIVGSEGRYNDFNKTFLPKREHLRNRWTSIDSAYYKDVNLPPIKLYKLGEVYFVRDGNHRVSVAKTQGIGAIDAEVVELSAHIKVTKGMTMGDIKCALIAYERERVISSTGMDKIIDMELIRFTATGRYDEMLRHILGHKYFISQEAGEEVEFEAALSSWFNSIFLPIHKIIVANKLSSRFPGRTDADIYMWIVKHWDGLKSKYGQDFPLEEAAAEYSSLYGRSRLQQFLSGLKKILVRIFRKEDPHSADSKG
ncbi:MAG: transcriptional regulator [Spirochaetales bacterium]|nr:transcriptional regulator [Spirochaetales bacterium]